MTPDEVVTKTVTGTIGECIKVLKNVPKKSSAAADNFRQHQLECFLENLPEFLLKARTDELTLLSDGLIGWVTSSDEERQHPERCVLAESLRSRLIDSKAEANKQEELAPFIPKRTDSSPLHENLIRELRDSHLERFYATAFLSELWLLIDLMTYSESERSCPGVEDECPLFRAMESRVP